MHIINEGHEYTEDIDRALEGEPDQKWTVKVTFFTFHLTGGKVGMRHIHEQFGQTLKIPWPSLKDPNWSNKLIKILV